MPQHAEIIADVNMFAHQTIQINFIWFFLKKMLYGSTDRYMIWPVITNIIDNSHAMLCPIEDVSAMYITHHDPKNG